MMELNEKQFITGFNTGYLLAEYEPQILTELLKRIQPINSYISGVSFGQKEFELDQTKTHLNQVDRIRLKTRNDRDNER